MNRKVVLPIVVFMFTILLGSSIPISFQNSEQLTPDVSQERVLVYIQTGSDKQKESIISRSDVTVRFTFDDNWISAEVPQHVKEILENRPDIVVEDVSIFNIDAKKDCTDPANSSLPQCKRKGGDEPEPVDNDGDGVFTPEDPDDNDPCNPNPDHELCTEPDPNPARVSHPKNQVTWGLKKIYNNENLSVENVLAANGGTGVIVAVLDTGVYKDHPDLVNKILLCKDFTSKGKPKNTCDDGHGHGTHVSGSVLADGGSDKLGILGVAPAAKLFAFKVCTNAGLCMGDAVAKGINEAEKNGANIISMSFGGSSFATVEKNAIDNALEARKNNDDLLFIAAAGNYGPSANTILYPAAYNKIVAVAAVDSGLNVASFSSRGISNTWDGNTDRLVEVSGPGVAIESTMNDGSYATWSGTSMATPHISGLAANVWSFSDDPDATSIRSWLQSNSNDIFLDGYDMATGFGFPDL